MKFYDNTLSEQAHIEDAIKKYGWAAEHNFWWYEYYQYWYAPTHRTIFPVADRGALLTVYIERTQEYFVVFDPLAEPDDRIGLLTEYIAWIFSNTTAKKIWFQLDKSYRKEFLSTLPDAYRSNPIYYTLV